MSEKFSPFDTEPKVIYEKHTFKIVVGKASKTNPDEPFCIGLRAGNFARGGYTIFPPEFNLDLLKILLGQDDRNKDEIIIETIAELLGLLEKDSNEVINKQKVTKALRELLNYNENQ